MEKTVEFGWFPIDLEDNSNGVSLVDGLSKLPTSCGIGRCKHSKQSISLSQNDLLIILALF